MVGKFYYESAYGRSLSHAERENHKYAYKKMVNGKMRYYYDDDNVPDKGFSLKKFNRRTMELNSGISAPGLKKSREYDKTYYSVRPDGNKESYQEVDKDIYENSKARLFYKNEPVKNIAKRKIGEAKDAVGKTIDKVGDKAKDAFGADEKAKKEYKRKPIAITDKVSEVSKDAIETGKKIVDSLFDRKRKKK